MNSWSKFNPFCPCRRATSMTTWSLLRWRRTKRWVETFIQRLSTIQTNKSLSMSAPPVLAHDSAGLRGSLHWPLQHNDWHQGGQFLRERLKLHHSRLRRPELLYLGADHKSHFGSVSGRWEHSELCAATPDHLLAGHQWHRQYCQDLESAAREPCDQAPSGLFREDSEAEPVPNVRVPEDALGGVSKCWKGDRRGSA